MAADLTPVPLHAATAAALDNDAWAAATATDWREQLSALALQRGISTSSGQQVRFVSGAAAGAEPYEVFIGRTGQVPTRDNWHDRLNAAVWLSWPRTKAALNQRQLQAFAFRTGATRGAQRDAATLLDESGVVIAVAGDDQARELRQLVTAHAWRQLFVEFRGRWHCDWVPWLVGHAVMEKLMNRPYPGVTVRAQIVSVGATQVCDRTAVDAAAGAVLGKAAQMTPAHAPPLPLAGVPGWWAGNEQAAFFDDATIFRPVRPGATRR